MCQPTLHCERRVQCMKTFDLCGNKLVTDLWKLHKDCLTQIVDVNVNNYKAKWKYNLILFLVSFHRLNSKSDKIIRNTDQMNLLVKWKRSTKIYHLFVLQIHYELTACYIETYKNWNQHRIILLFDSQYSFCCEMRLKKCILNH